MERGWYAVYLGYLTASHLKTQQDGRIQEDLILVNARNGAEAFRKAVELGEEVGRFGAGLLHGDQDALCELGLHGESVELGSPETPNSFSELVHPSLVETYEQFQFLGISRLVTIQGVLGHGSEIDVRERSMTLDELKVPAREDLLAFCPAGPAYDGVARAPENERLFRKFRWYLAEQLYRAGSTADRRSLNSVLLERLVLIQAEDPDAAFTMANRKPLLKETDITSYFGLQQLSLITDEIRDCCEIRSALIDVPEEILGKYSRSSEALGL